MKKIDKNMDSKEHNKYSFSKLMTWLFLTGSVILLAYVYYRSEVYFMGNRDGIYLKYYLVSILGIVFFLVILFLREKVRENVITIVLSLIVSVYLIEA